MKKDIKDYLHLYWGCEVSVKNIDSRYTRLMTHEFINSYYDEDSDSFLNDPKLLLRPLNTMTKEQKAELMVNLIQDISITHNDLCKWDVNQFRYLLSKGFDIFNLIPAGLAIDATTLKKEV